MGKLIDADDLIFDLKTSFVPQSTDYTNAVGIALRWLREAPEVVVRCRECEFFRPCDGFPMCVAWGNNTGPDGWCYMGKRRADDG